MSSILNTSHSPPNAMDDNANIATPSHIRKSPLTESSVARLYVERHRFAVYRETDGFFIPHKIPESMDDDIVQFTRGGYVPDMYILNQIRMLIDELSVDADEITAARLGSWSFLRGVFAFLCNEPALFPRHRRNRIRDTPFSFDDNELNDRPEEYEQCA
jgi:hypothetical protein